MARENNVFPPIDFTAHPITRAERRFFQQFTAANKAAMHKLLRQQLDRHQHQEKQRLAALVDIYHGGARQLSTKDLITHLRHARGNPVLLLYFCLDEKYTRRV